MAVRVGLVGRFVAATVMLLGCGAGCMSSAPKDPLHAVPEDARIVMLIQDPAAVREAIVATNLALEAGAPLPAAAWKDLWSDFSTKASWPIAHFAGQIGASDIWVAGRSEAAVLFGARLKDRKTAVARLEHAAAARGVRVVRQTGKTMLFAEPSGRLELALAWQGSDVVGWLKPADGHAALAHLEKLIAQKVSVGLVADEAQGAFARALGARVPAGIDILGAAGPRAEDAQKALPGMPAVLYVGEGRASRGRIEAEVSERGVLWRLKSALARPRGEGAGQKPVEPWEDAVFSPAKPAPGACVLAKGAVLHGMSGWLNTADTSSQTKLLAQLKAEMLRSMDGAGKNPKAKALLDTLGTEVERMTGRFKGGCRMAVHDAQGTPFAVFACTPSSAEARASLMASIAQGGAVQVGKTTLAAGGEIVHMAAKSRPAGIPAPLHVLNRADVFGLAFGTPEEAPRMLAELAAKADANACDTRPVTPGGSIDGVRLRRLAEGAGRRMQSRQGRQLQSWARLLAPLTHVKVTSKQTKAAHIGTTEIRLSPAAPARAPAHVKAPSKAKAEPGVGPAPGPDSP